MRQRNIKGKGLHSGRTSTAAVWNEAAWCGIVMANNASPVPAFTIRRTQCADNATFKPHHDGMIACFYELDNDDRAGTLPVKSCTCTGNRTLNTRSKTPTLELYTTGGLFCSIIFQ